jgi:molecular chaperone GrpE
MTAKKQSHKGGGDQTDRHHGAESHRIPVEGKNRHGGVSETEHVDQTVSDTPAGFGETDAPAEVSETGRGETNGGWDSDKTHAAGGKQKHGKGGADDPVAAAEAKAAEYLAIAQRTQADFDNFRKRTSRDAGLAEQRGLARLTKELLPALDHFEIALREASTGGGTPDEVLKGFRLVHDEFVSALERAGIERFSPNGEVFDPNEHEAMAQQPSEAAESGTVIEVYQQGYRINGVVLRPARVVVAA